MAKNKKRINEVIGKARHPAEIPMTVVAIVITVAVYGLLTYALVFGASDVAVISKIMSFLGAKSRAIDFCIRVGGPAIFVVLLFLLGKLVMASVSYVGEVSTENPRLDDTKYDEVKKIYSDFISELEIAKAPVVYVGDHKDPSYLGVTICSEKVICLSQRTITNAYKSEDFSEVRDELVRKLARIYLGHYYIPMVVFSYVARLLPIFHSICERILCYSVDGFSKEVLGKEEVISKLFYDNYDGDNYSEEDDINEIVKKTIKNVSSYEKNGRAYNNFFSSEPPVIYRLDALVNDKPGKVL